jgi:hypothetical protein
MDKNTAAELQYLAAERVSSKDRLDAENKKLETYIGELDKKVSNILFTAGLKTIDVKTNRGINFISCPSIIKITKVSRKKVIWNIPKMKEILDKDVCSELITKKVSIPDPDAFVKLMKKYNVNPKEFKKLLYVEESVNEQGLNQMYELGDISVKEVNSFCKVEEGTSYLKYTTTAEKEPDGE